MDRLLLHLYDGTLASETTLVQEHHHHFAKRARPLNECFFPGREKSEEAVASLSNGAYASFLKERAYDGLPAFKYAVEQRLPPKLFLYYWRDSATIRFLLDEGGWHLAERYRLLKNLRTHLRQAFKTMGRKRGSVLWGLPEWEDCPIRPVPAVESIHLEASRLRGKAAIRSVLEQAAGPLPLSDIASVFWRAPTELIEDRISEMAAVDPQGESEVLRRQVQMRVEHLFSSILDADDRRLLRLRGFAQDGKPHVPFRAVAKQLGSRRTPEYYRRRERKIFDRLRDCFPDRDEAEYAVEALVERLRKEVAP